MEALRQDGFRFIIYPNDHNPSHVHVKKAGLEIIINLGSEEEAPRFRVNKADRNKKRVMSQQDALKAFRICCENQEELLNEWRKIHG